MKVSAGTQLESTGFITPENKVVLVVMNRQGTDIVIKIRDVLPSTGAAQAIKFTAIAHSIQTFIYQ